MDIFTYIGVGVVAGAIIGLVGGVVDAPAIGVGLVAGPVSAVVSWYVVRRTGSAGDPPPTL